jgi:hypothetical protein
MYETCIRILHVTLGKTEGKTLLNETNSWIQKGSETTCGMHGKKVSEMKKTHLTSYIHGKPWIITKPFFELSFTKGKLEVDVGIDCSLFVFRSVHVASLYRFIQIVDVKVFGEVLVNKQTTSAAVDKGFNGLFTRANIDGNRDRIPRNISYGYRVNIQVRRH